MPSLTNRRYLICYDIADPRRLGKLHRYMKKHCLPLQYSVFLAWENSQSLDRLMAPVKKIIKANRDDVRVYPLPTELEYSHLGRQPFPDGVRWMHPGVQQEPLGLSSDGLSLL
jgi:CRISPR-associated protein Cas2